MDDQQLDKFLTENFQTILDHTSNGGSILELSRIWQVSFIRITRWLSSDEQRATQYKRALDARGEWFEEVILNEYRGIATTRISDAFNDDGSLKNPKEWPEELQKGIASVETEELFEGQGRDRAQIGFTKKLKFWDKRAALSDLAKTRGLFIDVHKHEAGESLEELIMKGHSQSGKNNSH